MVMEVLERVGMRVCYEIDRMSMKVGSGYISPSDLLGLSLLGGVLLAGTPPRSKNIDDV